MNTDKRGLWIMVVLFAFIAVYSFSGGSSDPNTGNLSQALGRLVGIVFGLAAAGLALMARRK